MSETPVFDHTDFTELVAACMPFGKYAGQRIIDLPEDYLVWFAGKGFPEGKLGRMMQAVYEIKLNGLEALLDPLRQAKE
ncbi:MAG: DUF3820 family protein [Desulfuromonadales bacterium]